MEKEKPIIISIRKAREQGVTDDLILSEIKKQNPEKEPFFIEAEKRGATAQEILNEIIKQNTKEETISKVPVDLFSENDGEQ
jgi:formate-dependent nitrite reductase cytochrome c552 subunit